MYLGLFRAICRPCGLRKHGHTVQAMAVAQGVVIVTCVVIKKASVERNVPGVSSNGDVVATAESLGARGGDGKRRSCGEVSCLGAVEAWGASKPGRCGEHRVESGESFERYKEEESLAMVPRRDPRRWKRRRRWRSARRNRDASRGGVRGGV
ncbi:hypothetical protein EDB81DRAFT_257503 [Dactylonectria macrodidyma]|uniref:Uncharacterized protein n=1 Tax=Dactylonectria macrodidyma TaxID=307937 RepID=A0A9P9JMG3_9HYPO|nr:hypothetical protein EDB81DRAFT_257503 [Dactylonectria macrodidyma]